MWLLDNSLYLNKTFLTLFLVPNFKQFLDEVLVISGKIKVQVSVISRGKGRGGAVLGGGVTSLVK